MSPENQETQEQEQTPLKKGGMLKWIILIVLLGALGGGGFFAYTYFMAPEEKPAAEEMQEPTAEEAVETDVKGKLVSLDPFVVNLADPLGRRFLKINMDLEVADDAANEAVNKNMPKIKDAILLLLSSKAYADLTRIEDKLLLKREIVERINQVVGKSKVLNVFFTEFVIQ